MQPTNQRDYFAELYVAGILSDAGWNVYFPRRDKGFDFIVTKTVGDSIIVRPVQVKGKYPEPDKTDKATYGFIGDLTELHNAMVLAMPFFPTDNTAGAPRYIAFMPRSRIRPQKGRGYRCEPCTFRDGAAAPRRDYQQYFNQRGLDLMENLNWQ